MAVVAHDHRAPHVCSAWYDGQRLREMSSARFPTRGIVVCGPSVAHTPHDPTPSSHDARGPAGPAKGAMAFLDDAEATTYRMLKQVLQNHCTTQTLCLPHTMGACGALVALVCAQLEETRDALEPAVAHMLADLKHSAQFIIVCSSSILTETLGYAGVFSSPLHGKRRVFERGKPVLYGSTATVYKV